jgi:hypothetical protein
MRSIDMRLVKGAWTRAPSPPIRASALVPLPPREMIRRFLHRLDRLDAWLTGALDRRRGWIMAGFAVLYLAVTCALAWYKPLWIDELYTYYICRLPTPFDIWSILATGVEGIPPSFHLLTRASVKLLGENHLSVRLPEILGVGGMTLCLFQIVSRRSSSAYGAVAMLVPLVTHAYDYAYEARPYGLVLGLSAASMLCWQSAAAGVRRAPSLLGLTAALAGALASHYYGVLLLVPLAAGELVRSAVRRRLDVPVWLALSVATLPLLLFLPLIQAARAVGPGFWAKPRWSGAVSFYRTLLEPALLPVVAILVVLATYAIIRSHDRREPGWASSAGPPLHEVVAAFGYLAIPAVAVILAKLVTGAFTARYALPAVVGLAILLAWGAYHVLDRRASMGVVLALVLASWFAVTQGIKGVGELRQEAAGLRDTYRFLRETVPTDERIVVANAHEFFQLTHYAPPEMAPRLVYLADPSAARRYLGSDTAELGLAEFRRWTALAIEYYAAYASTHRRLLVYGRPGGRSWLLPALLANGARVELLAQHGPESLLRVELDPDAGPLPGER